MWRLEAAPLSHVQPTARHAAMLALAMKLCGKLCTLHAYSTLHAFSCTENGCDKKPSSDGTGPHSHSDVLELEKVCGVQSSAAGVALFLRPLPHAPPTRQARTVFRFRDGHLWCFEHLGHFGPCWHLELATGLGSFQWSGSGSTCSRGPTVSLLFFSKDSLCGESCIPGCSDGQLQVPEPSRGADGAKRLGHLGSHVGSHLWTSCGHFESGARKQ